MTGQPAFAVVGRDHPHNVLLRTDNPFLAQQRASKMEFQRGRGHYYPWRVVGTHPTHTFDGGSCTACGAPNNGCYRSEWPCGYDSGSRNAIQVWEDELGEWTNGNKPTGRRIWLDACDGPGESRTSQEREFHVTAAVGTQMGTYFKTSKTHDGMTVWRWGGRHPDDVAAMHGGAR